MAICPNLGWGADFFAAQSFIDPLFNGENIVPSGNVNTAEVDDPKLNAQIDRAKQITDPAEAAQGLGRPRQGGHRTRPTSSRGCGTTTSACSRANMKGVSSKFNSGAYDFAFSSLK